jgi:predicted Ser/Thr protein kinase
MNHPAAIDYAKLSRRIGDILKTHKPGKIKIDEAITNNSIVQGLTGLIEKIIMSHVTSKPEYWESAGIRTQIDESFMKCKAKYSKMGTFLGRGAFGVMMKVPSPPCLTKIPKDVKEVAMKFETLIAPYEAFQSPTQVATAFKIALKAAEIGVGPKIYDTFITHDDNGFANIVKVFEFLDGTSWEDAQWENEKEKQHAVKILKKKIELMNKEGIIHHDLHIGNVMVTKSNDVFIVDFDRANFVEKEEIDRLGSFNETIPYNYEPTNELMKPDTLKEISQILVKEGTIRLNNEGARKTRRNKHKKN